MSPNKVNRPMGQLGESASSVETAIIRSVMTSEDPLRDELLLGIPNDVTLNDIATVLPWRACQVLSTVSPDWQRACQGRMVYDARVRSRSTETFFVVLSWITTALQGETRSVSIKLTLSLFSPREERCYTLPGRHSEMPIDCEHIIFDGSIYLLGGTGRSRENYFFSAEVYVLDLAGHPLEWRRCANMQVPRRRCAVGVMHGKIFVFGGESEDTYHEVRNEVYDPKADAWSWIAPMMPSVSLEFVVSVGQDFFLCCGHLSGCCGNPKPTARNKPVSDDEADIRGDTKLVVTVSAGGPRLISTSNDAAEDEMDGLHEIIENQLVNLEEGVGLFAQAPAVFLASFIMRQRDRDRYQMVRPVTFLRAYDPVKDEWREFEKESLGTDNLNLVRPKHFLDLGRDPDAHSRASALVWPVSL